MTKKQIEKLREIMREMQQKDNANYARMCKQPSDQTMQEWQMSCSEYVGACHLINELGLTKQVFNEWGNIR